MKMIDRIKKFQERNKEQNSNNFNESEDIFFDLSEGTHRVRLVGDWTCVHSHWIGPSQFSRVQFYPESAFKGENRLRKNINCPDFDIDSETINDEKVCTICKLHDIANDILFEGIDLDSNQKKFLNNIAHDARPAERIFFLCIDRDNPEIAPGKKGFKIIEFPRALMEQWMQLVNSNPELDPNSVEEGVDYVIIKSKDGKKNKYSIQYAMKGTKLCQTPLTEEEKAFERLDIKKIMGKMPEQDALYDRLLPEFKELIEDQNAANSGNENPENNSSFEDDNDEEDNIPF